jgi:hypothetical protein
MNNINIQIDRQSIEIKDGNIILNWTNANYYKKILLRVFNFIIYIICNFSLFLFINISNFKDNIFINYIIIFYLIYINLI